MINNVINGDSTKKNFSFQFIYQIIILVIPLIISPYLTRVLGREALGIYTFTYSVAYYFVVCANMGISKYGQRIVAERKSDINYLRKTVWSLIFFHMVISFIVLLLYVIYIIFFCNKYVDIAIIQAVFVFSTFLDYTWFFQGVEKFKNVVIRNFFVKFLEFILIFVLVKTVDDLIVYTLIMSLSVCLGHIVVLPQIIKIIPPIKVRIKDFKEHIKPMIILFVASIAATLYTVFDKTLLGVLSDIDDVAIYEYSNKIITIPKSFIIIISTVLFPKACKMISNGSFDIVKKDLENSLIINYFIGFASIWGLMGISNLFSEIYFGAEFIECGNVMIAMSPLILIIGLGEVLRSQYIYPLKKDKIMIKILLLNALINIIISIILIPKIGIYGAVIGTIAAELFGLIFQLILCKEYVSIKKFFGVGIPFFIIGFIMFCGIKVLNFIVEENLCGLLIKILISALIYVTLSLIYCYKKNEYIRNLCNKVIKKIRK